MASVWFPLTAKRFWIVEQPYPLFSILPYIVMQPGSQLFFKSYSSSQSLLVWSCRCYFFNLALGSLCPIQTFPWKGSICNPQTLAQTSEWCWARTLWAWTWSSGKWHPRPSSRSILDEVCGRADFGRFKPYTSYNEWACPRIQTQGDLSRSILTRTHCQNILIARTWGGLNNCHWKAKWRSIYQDDGEEESNSFVTRSDFTFEIVWPIFQVFHLALFKL